GLSPSGGGHVPVRRQRHGPELLRADGQLHGALTPQITIEAPAWSRGLVMCATVGVPYGANATWLLIASNASFASTWVALMFAYQVVPPMFDWLAAYLSMSVDAVVSYTFKLEFPLKAALTFSKVLHVGMSLQIFARSI